MPSVLIQTADAVVAELNDPANEWSQVFTAERSYADWDLPLEDESQLGKVLCDVVPVGRLVTDLETSGGSVGYEPAIDIVLRKKYELQHVRTDNGRLILSAVDEMVALVEEINEHFTPIELDTDNGPRWSSTEIVAAVMHKHLKDYDQFTGIVRVTFDASN